MSETLHETECNAYRLRIEFLEESIRNYQSLPADLLGSFDVEQCSGNCNVLRQNFWDVWSTNTSLHAKFEQEMQRYKEEIRERDGRIMELTSVNALLEQSLQQTPPPNNNQNNSSTDLEEYFHRKLDEERATIALLRDRAAELEEALYLKEQESGARQMQINHLLSLPNQFEHAAEVNAMRTKLWDAEKRIQELMLVQRFGEQQAPRLLFTRVDLDKDPRLAQRFRDFFRRTDAEGPTSAENAEESLYGRFLLDQPNRDQHRLRPDMYVRDEVVEAMRAVCGPEAKGGPCKRNFAACLAAMGGKFKRKRGARYWVNMVVTRKPLFSWDV
jgi:hypothetical protein